MVLADELAKQQRSISVAEFFEKNKHLLGFDSPTRGVITTIKEAVDNSLDACEEAQVLPDIFISIKKVTSEVFRIIVEDNGPGIVPAQVPFVFGKLLYGSRFHQIRQTRGQQGIGISAAVLYAQLTSGVPTIVISRTGAKESAHKFEIQIHIETNEPDIISEQPFEWDRIHGTRVQIEFKSTMSAKKKLLEYLRYTSVVNPHARFRVELDDESFTFERVSQEVIACPVAIQPHPHGIEFGQLKRMAAASELKVLDFLVESFSRVGKKSAQEMCDRSGLKGTLKVNGLSSEDLKKLLAAMQEVVVPAPPATQCLSPIGEELLRRGLEKEFQMDFVASRTRPSSVFSGHPFMVEAAIGYGGRLPAEGNAILLRFANRVPLMYQQGACAITECVTGINWKLYNIPSQGGFPTGPVLILVHVASTNVPFTSESKDAIAGIPEIEKEITLALQDLGRELKNFVSRRDKGKLAEDRARAVCAIIPEIAEKVSEIVEKPLVDTTPIEGKLMRKMIAKKATRDGRVTIELNNYTAQDAEVSVYEISHDDGADAIPRADFVSEMDGQFTKVWKATIPTREVWRVSFTGKGGGILDIRGIEDAKKMVVDLDVSKEELEKKSMAALLRIASAWYDQMKAGEIPSISLPTRTKYNIEFDDASEVWKYGDKESMRTAASAKSATHLLKMAYVIGFIKQQLKENRSSTLREMYYISEGWKRAKFGAQDESNFLIEDLEILSDVPREGFHLHPEENGASIYGPMRIREQTRRGMKAIHCQDDVGQAGYTIPNNVENIEFVDHDAKFVIAIETGGMYDRLIENGFDEEHNAILIHLKGQPARSTRRMLNKISATWDLPVMVFTDGDPWSYRIFASVAYGAIKSAHMSELLATPKSQFLGLQPSDIRDYNLPSDKLTEKDVEALKSELTDPRFATDYWKKEITLQLEMNLKSEQQAFAARGLDFVTKKYLPDRLAAMGII